MGSKHHHPSTGTARHTDHVPSSRMDCGCSISFTVRAVSHSKRDRGIGLGEDHYPSHRLAVIGLLDEIAADIDRIHSSCDIVIRIEHKRYSDLVR